MKTGGNAGKQKIWITGGSGFLGGTLIRFLRTKYEIVASYHKHPLQVSGVRGFKISLNSREEVRNFLAAEKVDAVLHCAALTDVDYCEKHYDEALKINAEVPGTLAGETARNQIYFVHISTESVYGDTPGPHREDETLAPINLYAASKVKGEEAVQKAGRHFLIARTGFEGWSFSPGAKVSFFEWLTRKLAEGNKFHVFSDRVFTPFSIYNFADVLDEMIAERIAGVYNVEGPEAVTYFRFAQEVARVFDFDASLLLPAKMDDVLRGAKRVHDTSLDVSRIQSRLKTRLLGVDEMLRQFKEIRNKVIT